MYIISDEQWARESSGQIRQLRLLVIDVSYKLLKEWFSCPDVAPPPPISLDGPAVHQQQNSVPPPIPLFRDFIYNAVTRTRTPLNAMVAAMYLVRRLKERNSNCAGTSITPHRVMLAAIMLACKLLYDDTYSNRTWVHVSQGIFSLEEINRMEWEFLSYIKFEAAISREEWIEHVTDMDVCVTREENHDPSLTTLQHELNMASIQEDTRFMSPDELAVLSQLSLHQLQQMHQLPQQQPQQPQPVLANMHAPVVSRSHSQSRIAAGMPAVSSSSVEDVSLPSAAEHGTMAGNPGSTRVTRSLSRRKSSAASAASASASSSNLARPTPSLQPQSHSAKVMPSMPSVAMADPVPRPNSAAAALAAHRSSASTSSLPSATMAAPPVTASWHQGSHSHGALSATTYPLQQSNLSHHFSHGHAPPLPGQPSMGQQYMQSVPYPPAPQHQSAMYPPSQYPSAASTSSSSRTPLPTTSSSGSHGSSGSTSNSSAMAQHHHHHHSAPPGHHYNISRPYPHALHSQHAHSGSSNASGAAAIPVIPPPLQPQAGSWYPPPAWPTHSYSQQQPSHASQNHRSAIPPPHVPTSSSYAPSTSQHVNSYAHPQPPAQMQPAHLVPPPPSHVPMPSSSAIATRDVVPALVRAHTGSNPATVGMSAGVPLSASQQQQQQAALLAAAAAAAAGQLNKRGDSGTDLHALQQLHGLAGTSSAVMTAQHAQYLHHHRGPAVSGALGGGMVSVTVGGGHGPGSASNGAHGVGGGSTGFGQ